MRLLHMGSAALAAALMAVSAVDTLSRENPHREPRRFKLFELPKSNGPVIDTTKESKRAKRRRLAKGK